ncbi:YciI family protein [Actinoplanes sp. NPDC049599]|uniref:YciI family protein n=1 Tax=Actinoplanes sp. NPDC049599 TaxID=3363903 RepID=UPI0037A68FED
MRYLILIQSNEQSLAVWESLSDEQRMAFGRGHLQLGDEMIKAGVHVASEGLADPSLARFVSVRDGRTISSDGPFAEAKEHLAGFYLIDCETFDEAVEWAAKVPDAAFTEVEVRPVLDMSGWEF